jgi:hypothetical protein
MRSEQLRNMLRCQIYKKGTDATVRSSGGIDLFL